jgi:hypothetical protein
MTLHEYRHHAAKCLQIAEGATDFQQRSSLLNMAQSWLRLAQQAEKNLATDLVYQTPAPPGEAGRPSVRQQQQQIQPGKDEVE